MTSAQADRVERNEEYGGHHPSVMQRTKETIKETVDKAKDMAGMGQKRHNQSDVRSSDEAMREVQEKGPVLERMDSLESKIANLEQTINTIQTPSKEVSRREEEIQKPQQTYQEEEEEGETGGKKKKYRRKKTACSIM